MSSTQSACCRFRGSVHWNSVDCFFFNFSTQTCCGYTLELPWWGISSEHQKTKLFLYKNRKYVYQAISVGAMYKCKLSPEIVSQTNQVWKYSRIIVFVFLLLKKNWKSTFHRLAYTRIRTMFEKWNKMINIISFKEYRSLVICTKTSWDTNA